MDQSTMDKKILPRSSLLPSKNGQETTSKDFPVKKNGQGFNGRKRDNDKVENSKKQTATRGGRGAQRYVKPREKTQSYEVKGEEGSLYHGRKKQNITHLMDWWGPSPNERNVGQRKNFATSNKGGARQKWNSSACHKYNKEHYIQANCQFVVMTGEDYSLYEHDPDKLVQWHLVEEVRLQVSEISNCPICLHPPIAAQVTRCGHIYCYSCILHYLALTDDNWRKCPICDDEIVKDDLKSARCVVYKDYQLGEEVTFQLMRRERDSLIPGPISDYKKSLSTVAKLDDYNALSPHCKLFAASNTEVCDYIIAREERELEFQMAEEGDQPEICFTIDALQLLKQRKEALLSLDSHLSKLSLSQESKSVIERPISYSDEFDGNGNKNTNFNNQYQQTDSVTAEDLDISQLQPNTQQGQVSKSTAKPTFYFYQATNGSHMYLHALNVQMLVHDYGSLDICPPIITGKILEKESASMTEDLRNRLRYLRHLPITCSFEVVEINFSQPIISATTVTEFQNKIEIRKRKRNKRAKEERKIERRVKAEEDKMLGRGPRMKTSIQSAHHFPSIQDDSPTSSGQVEFDVDPGFISTSPTMSVESDQSIPSFAQMIREQPSAKSRPLWGAGNSASSCVWGSLDGKTIVGRSRTTTECSDDLEQNIAAPPEYRQTFTDTFSMALDAAVKKSQEKNDSSDGNRKGKKKKRQKGTILLSSGGF